MRKFKTYQSDGYGSLIHKAFGNDNSKKINDRIGTLLKAIYTMPNNPFAADVHETYMAFLRGEKDIFNVSTGELFDRREFCKNGKPIELSERAISRYLNEWMNRIAVDKIRMDEHDFRRTHEPHHNRHRPLYAYSKISMDDRDLPRKIKGGGDVRLTMRTI